MSSKTSTTKFTEICWDKEMVKRSMESADAIVIGAGAGQRLFCVDHKCGSLLPEGGLR